MSYTFESFDSYADENPDHFTSTTFSVASAGDDLSSLANEDNLVSGSDGEGDVGSAWDDEKSCVSALSNMSSKKSDADIQRDVSNINMEKLYEFNCSRECKNKRCTKDVTIEQVHIARESMWGGSEAVNANIRFDRIFQLVASANRKKKGSTLQLRFVISYPDKLMQSLLLIAFYKRY